MKGPYLKQSYQGHHLVGHNERECQDSNKDILKKIYLTDHN